MMAAAVRCCGCTARGVDWHWLLQRQEKDDAATHPGGSSAAEGPASTAARDGGGAAERLKEPKLLRTYAQKKAKADPVSEQAPMLDPGVLALVAGKNPRRTAQHV